MSKKQSKRDKLKASFGEKNVRSSAATFSAAWAAFLKSDLAGGFYAVLAGKDQAGFTVEEYERLCQIIEKRIVMSPDPQWRQATVSIKLKDGRWKLENIRAMACGL